MVDAAQYINLSPHCKGQSLNISLSFELVCVTNYHSHSATPTRRPLPDYCRHILTYGCHCILFTVCTTYTSRLRGLIIIVQYDDILLLLLPGMVSDSYCHAQLGQHRTEEGYEQQVRVLLETLDATELSHPWSVLSRLHHAR